MHLPIELLAVDSQRALNFFYSNLRHVTETQIRRSVRRHITELQRVYIASMLASFSRASAASNIPGSMPIYSSWHEILTEYVDNKSCHDSTELMEHAAGNSLLLVGFCSPYLERNYNLVDCCQCGSFLFKQAAIGKKRAQAPEEEALLRTLAENFLIWGLVIEQLANYLKDSPYLIPFGPPSS